MYRLKTLIPFSIIILMMSCSSIRPFSQDVINNLILLKTHTQWVYENFQKGKYDQKDVNKVENQIQSLIKDEQKRKPKSKEHINQLNLILDMFKRHTAHIKDHLKSKTFIASAKKNILKVIDIALATETTRKSLK